MSELKLCPSCGSKVPKAWSAVGGDYWVSCRRCRMAGPLGFTAEKAEADWQALPRRSDTEALRNELIGVLTQIKTSEIGGRYAGIGQRIDELVKEGTV